MNDTYLNFCLRGFDSYSLNQKENRHPKWMSVFLVRPVGIEPTAFTFGVYYSIP